jgi:acyl-CoA hydrolase
MLSGRGSSSEASFWLDSRICLSSRMTASSARTDFSRPTNSGTIMCGNTTMSRKGRTGKL